MSAAEWLDNLDRLRANEHLARGLMHYERLLKKSAVHPPCARYLWLIATNLWHCESKADGHEAAALLFSCGVPAAADIRDDALLALKNKGKTRPPSQELAKGLRAAFVINCRAVVRHLRAHAESLDPNAIACLPNSTRDFVEREGGTEAEAVSALANAALSPEGERFIRAQRASKGDGPVFGGSSVDPFRYVEEADRKLRVMLGEVSAQDLIRELNGQWFEEDLCGFAACPVDDCTGELLIRERAPDTSHPRLGCSAEPACTSEALIEALVRRGLLSAGFTADLPSRHVLQETAGRWVKSHFAHLFQMGDSLHL